METPLTLTPDYIEKLDHRISTSMMGIEAMVAAIETKEDAEAVIRRIDSFLEVIAYSQGKICWEIQEIRSDFDIKKLSLGFFRIRAKIAIDRERDRQIAELDRVLISVEKQVARVKNIRKSVQNYLES